MGKPWDRTPEQTKHLNGRFDDYLKARQNGTVEAFRAKLYDGWANLWPERAALFPLWKEGDPPLTKDQMTALGKAIGKRKKQLYDYVRWHSLGKVVRTKNASALLSRYVLQMRKTNKKGRKKPTRRARKRTILEVYSDLYYEEKLQPLVKDAVAKDLSYGSLPPKKRSARQMVLYRKIRAECWVAESDAVKAEVQRAYNQEHQDKAVIPDAEDEDGGDDGDEKTVLQHQQECIDVIGQIVTTFLQEVSEATGWAFYVLAGGLNKTGEIKVATSSIGKTVGGSTFQTNHKNWQEGVIAPWLDFLHLRHPIEERHRHAMIWAEDPSARGGSTLSNTPSENATITKSLQTAAPVVSPTTAMGSPQQTAPASDLNLSHASLPTTQNHAYGFNMDNSADVSISTASSLNALNEFNPAFGYPSHVTSQPATSGITPLSNSASAYMTTTDQFYGWEGASGKAAGSKVPLVPMPKPLNETHWTFPPLSTFPSTEMYQSHHPTALDYALEPAMTNNEVLIDSGPGFPLNRPIDHSSSVPVTTQSTATTPNLNPVVTSSTGIPNPTSFALGDAVVGTPGQRSFTPLTTANVDVPTTEMTAHSSVNNPGLAANLVLNNATNRVLAGTVESGNHTSPMGNTEHGERREPRPKKRKSREEENAQLILPDGCRRPHKPRRVDENNVATSIGKKGRVAKKVKST